MPYKFRTNAGPSIERIVIVAILLMLELILIKLVEIFSQNRMPTPQEVGLLLALGLLQLVTYLLNWLRKEEASPPSTSSLTLLLWFSTLSSFLFPTREHQSMVLTVL